MASRAEELKHPDCRYCEECLRVNVGIMEANRQLKRKLADAGSLTAEKTDAARKLWDAATAHWYDATSRRLQDRLHDSSVALSGEAIRGSELYEIGVELGFIEEGSG